METLEERARSYFESAVFTAESAAFDGYVAGAQNERCQGQGTSCPAFKSFQRILEGKA